MKTFQVFIKGQANPVVVKAEKVQPLRYVLTFFNGDEAVATFKNSEVQGWQEIVTPARR
jgi:hypothetical protein